MWIALNSHPPRDHDHNIVGARGAFGEAMEGDRAWPAPSRVNGYDREVKLTIDLDREEDGRWIAEALELPGVMCYGQTRDAAISNAERLAIEVIADRIAHGELQIGRASCRERV